MSWWNPFSTEAANGKTQADLDAETRALDAQRAARKQAEADALEANGDYISAEAARAAQAEWTKQHNENLATEAASLEETPYDAFTAELGAQADKLRGGFTEAITTSIKTLLRLVPWPVWVAAILFGLWKLGLLNKLWKKVAE